ncbi:MAG: hypothetical protein IPI18_17865 [Saprospiraceae bacterium]|nr:hypothetical protein [Saprospiraceae bacterium]
MAKKEAPKPNRPSGIDYHLSPGIPHKKSIFSFDNTVFYNRKNFTILSILTLLGMISLSIHFGVNGDEKFSNRLFKKALELLFLLG